jgi:hypothetical protein
MNPSPKWPSDLARKNQRILAERQQWPAGALQACMNLENRFPGWHVSWLEENTATGFERPAGYWAVFDHGGLRVEVLRADPAQLPEVMAGVPEHDYSTRGCEWCLPYSSTRRVRL